MVINPATGKEEELIIKPLESVEGATQSAVNPEGLGGTFKADDTLQKATDVTVTATEGIASPGLVADEEITAVEETFVPQADDAVVDIAEEKKGDVPVLTLDRETFTDVLSKAEKDRTEEEKQLIRKFKAKRALGETTEGIFGETVTEGDAATDDAAKLEADKQIAGIKETSAKAIVANEAQVAARLEQAQTNIQNRGKERSKTLDRSLSFSGFGRSSTAVQKRDELQQSINQEIAIAQAKADLENKLFKARQEGADSETISGIRKNLADTSANLKTAEAKNAADLAKLNQELGLKADEALDSFLNGTSGGLDAKDKGFDKDASIALGYVSDSFGNPLVTDENGDPQAFTGSDLGSDVKISNFKDGNDNTYVYKNGELSQIIQNDGTILTGDDVKTAKVPAEVQTSKTNKDRIELEQKLRKEFNGSSQIKTFGDIKSNFQRVNAGVSADSAAGDLALIFSFMKMLDPGSVVRESEFATAENAAGVPEKIRNQYNKTISGERLGKDQRQDFLARAEDIFANETENATSVRDQFVRIAEDAGVTTDFITGAFDELSGIDTPFKLEADEETELDSIFGSETGGTGTTTGSNDFTSSSGKTFNITGFNGADQTAGNKGIPETGFTEQVEIVRTGTNVAKDTNNPGNITADSIPAGQSKEQYGQTIGATGTYLSPNGREYFIFPDVLAGTGALERDITAKITGGSRNIKPTDTLARFQRVYVGETSPNYLAVLKRITGANDNTKIQDIDPKILTQAVMKAEGFIT